MPHYTRVCALHCTDHSAALACAVADGLLTLISVARAGLAASHSVAVCRRAGLSTAHCGAAGSGSSTAAARGSRQWLLTRAGRAQVVGVLAPSQSLHCLSGWEGWERAGWVVAGLRRRRTAQAVVSAIGNRRRQPATACESTRSRAAWSGERVQGCRRAGGELRSALSGAKDAFKALEILPAK